ncbi:MAG: glycosyltransferase family 2 protein [Hahellaceae bacterium]|nr:glycosyltransferase family 2 protein [Hahellaceae bacterium]
MLQNNISVVIPAKNEAAVVEDVVRGVLAVLPDAQVIVVDDGSTDATKEKAESAGALVFSHLYSKGNGAAIKTGARRATGDIIVFMDADSQHRASDIPRLLERFNEGYDMVVGARSTGSQASYGRLAANTLYNRMASWMVGHRVDDLTSGFRVVRASYFRQFLHLLPNGFSYPTTITMSFFRSGYSVSYVPIEAAKRVGKSHISLSKDGIRFLLIIFKIGTLYSPLKLFSPISAFFFLTGSFYYLYTYMSAGRFTNMSALLFSTSVIIFLMGLISEQITSLAYSGRGPARSTDEISNGKNRSDGDKI